MGFQERDWGRYEEMCSLNQNLTFNYVKKEKIIFEDKQKKSLGVVSEDGLYTNLGLLLSDRCEHTLKVAVFQGKGKMVFRDRRVFSGSILKQLEEACRYIDFYNKRGFELKGLYRADERDYPEAVIREVLTNAIVHRDYSFSGSIIVNIFDTKMEFISLGGLVRGLSLEAVLSGVSQPRNEKLSEFFHRFHLMAAFGTGIRKIVTSYEKFYKKAEIITVQGGFKVVLPNVHYDKSKGKSIRETVQIL